MTEPRMFLVGGAIRDKINGIASKDLDFAVEHPQTEGVTVDEAFIFMVEWLRAEHGVEFFLETPEFVTARGRFPKDHPNLTLRRQACDFVLCRKDGPSKDGRRPGSVEIGTIFDDLDRRDFTCNAIAQEVRADGTFGGFVDPHQGAEDLACRTLRFVGDPMDRIEQDGLRVMRGFRFEITKGLTPTGSTWRACVSKEAAECLARISEERREQEMRRMFEHDQMATLSFIADLPKHTREAMFAGRVRLTPTLKAV